MLGNGGNLGGNFCGKMEQHRQSVRQVVRTGAIPGASPEGAWTIMRQLMEASLTTLGKVCGKWAVQPGNV